MNFSFFAAWGLLFQGTYAILIALNDMLSQGVCRLRITQIQKGFFDMNTIKDVFSKLLFRTTAICVAVTLAVLTVTQINIFRRSLIKPLGNTIRYAGSVRLSGGLPIPTGNQSRMRIRSGNTDMIISFCGMSAFHRDLNRQIS